MNLNVKVSTLLFELLLVFLAFSASNLDLFYCFWFLICLLMLMWLIVSRFDVVNTSLSSPSQGVFFLTQALLPLLEQVLLSAYCFVAHCLVRNNRLWLCPKATPASSPLAPLQVGTEMCVPYVAYVSHVKGHDQPILCCSFVCLRREKFVPLCLLIFCLGLHNQAFPTFGYDTSKAAIHHLTRSFAAHFGNFFSVPSVSSVFVILVFVSFSLF
jgi:NAD(P)-dependent dehydrogenase (short-subunit alcohol dehydrogenase family)